MPLLVQNAVQLVSSHKVINVLLNVVMETFYLDKNAMIKTLFLVMVVQILAKSKLTINVEESLLCVLEAQSVVME